jgi:exodeoxyribonuclease VIII
MGLRLNNIMVDMETLGTLADAPIMSIGAVRFDPFADEIADQGFYRSITLQSNFDLGRRPSESTLKWWMEQAATNAAAATVFTEQKVDLETALIEYVAWFWDGETHIHRKQVLKRDTCTWSNGADFDIPMLNHALDCCRIPIPWNFWNSRCVRTYKNLPGAERLRVPRIGTHHNALGDAITQAQLVQLINRTLFTNAYGLVRVA